MKFYTRKFQALALILGVLIAGCDSQSTDDSIFLTHTFTMDLDGDLIRYSFSSTDTQNGVQKSLSCGCALNADNFLAVRGFTRSEIIDAHVTSAKLKSLFPIGERLDYLSQAQLSLSAQGVSATAVAENESFPASQEVPLPTIQGVSILGHMQKTSFNPVVQINANSLEPNTDYELGIEFTVEFEMEGI
jgi:hypothetical protein